MAKFMLFVLALPLITLLQQCHEAQSAIYIMALQRLMDSIGVLSGLMGIYSFIQSYVETSIATHSVSDYGFQQMSVIAEIKELKQGLSNLREEIKFDIKIDQLIELINDVEYLFRDFVLYSTNFNKSSRQNHFQNGTYEIYTNYVFNVGNMGIGRTLDKIKDIVAPNDNVFPGLSFLQLKVLDSKEFSFICKRKLSHMQILAQLLGKIALVEAKGLLSILFAYDVLEWLGKGIYSEERKKAKVESLERYNTFVAQFQNSLKNVSNQLYTCDPKEHVLNKTYTALEPAFERKHGQNVCLQEVCSAFSHMNIRSCSDGFLLATSQCEATYDQPPLYDIHIPGFDNYNSASYNKTVDYVCFTYNEHGEEQYMLSRGPLSSCQLYFCTCSFEHKYYVSLANVTANVSQNFVVTGARLVLKDNIIFIQLQEGRLGPYERIDENTLHWIPIDNDLSQTHPINIFDNEFLLTRVKVPPYNVVTGASIEPIKSDLLTEQFGLRLTYAPINFTMGSLNDSDLHYVNVEVPPKPNLLTISHLNDPTTTNNNVLDSTDDNYVNIFTNPKTNKTTPYLDLQDVVSKLPTPLSGLSFIHKGTDESSGFLGLSILTYNVTPHVQFEYRDDKQILNSIK